MKKKEAKMIIPLAPVDLIWSESVFLQHTK